MLNKNIGLITYATPNEIIQKRIKNKSKLLNSGVKRKTYRFAKLCF